MSLQDAVEAVVGILGMQPCEGSDAVPPNARSHTVLLAGTFVGDVQVSYLTSLPSSLWSRVTHKDLHRSLKSDGPVVLHWCKYSNLAGNVVPGIGGNIW